MKKILILGLVLSFNANAQSATSGNCGPKDENGEYTSSCTWNYDKTTKTLNITGDGYMAESFDGYLDSNQDRYRTRAPWADFDREIQNVDIGGNLKNIGAYAVYGMPAPNVTISAPIEYINDQSLASARNIELPETLQTVNNSGLAWTSSTNAIILPESVETIGDRAFWWAGATKIILGSNVTSIGEDSFVSGYNEDHLVIYCEDTSQDRCSNLIGEHNSDYVSKLQLFTKDKDTGVYEVDGTYYANAELLVKDQACTDKAQCDEIALKAKNGLAFEFNGKFYASLDDFLTGNYERKRIYTIDEANRVAGEKKSCVNQVSIKKVIFQQS
ncbi:MAG: leucine-rich repeat protein [Alphaproteobacteria bacterium]|nr:leucine-rich repeat protein [Alphaproteobacteria bacterium]